NLSTFLLLGLILVISSTSMNAQLSGTYTICSSGCNYSSIGAAVNDMNNSGINGAVTFKVSSGTYNESVYVNPVTGASAANKVTFLGTGRGNSIITKGLVLDNCSYVNFNGFTMYGNTVIYNYNSKKCSVINCDLVALSYGYCLYDNYSSS